LSYANDPKTNTLKILEQNHYYPFGLKHENYNSEKKIFAKEEAEILQQGQASAANVMALNGLNVSGRMKIVPGGGGGGPVVYGERNYKYQGQERQDELGLNWDSFKFRNYDYAIGRFMCIDPLAEKYPYNSTYAFQENKMGMGRELEGLEIVLINPTKSTSDEAHRQADQTIVNGAKNIPNSSTMITVTAHGGPTGMANDVRGGRVTTAKELNSLLNRNSSDWKNKESGDEMTVVLYSCRTGANVKDKDGESTKPSFAQTISGSKEFENVEVIAPDQRMYFSEDGPVGTYEAKYAGKDNEYKADAKDHSRSETPGNWNVFKNGELIRSFQGDWKPTNKPSTWYKLTKQN
jgi:RHS repeat-associated protein